VGTEWAQIWAQAIKSKGPESLFEALPPRLHIPKGLIGIFDRQNPLISGSIQLSFLQNLRLSKRSRLPTVI